MKNKLNSPESSKNNSSFRKIFGKNNIITGGLILFDIFAFAGSFFLPLWLRFDCRYSMIPHKYLYAYYKFIPFYVIVAVVVFALFKLYKSIWKFASYVELSRTIIATFILYIFHIITITLMFGSMPSSYYVFGIMLQFILTIGIRFAYRFAVLLKTAVSKNSKNSESKKVMIIGAGNAGQSILRDIKISKHMSDEVCCIIDDDQSKWGRYIDGVLVEGGRDVIFKSVKKYGIDKIYVAIPSASAEQKRDILNICSETGCELKNLPGMYQLYSGQLTVSAMKNVAVEDLLGREPISVNMNEIFNYIKGKTVFISGGGGSIGSELSRQIAAHSPKRLIIFDIYENNAYDIQQELKKRYPTLDLVVLIGSVRDSRRLMQIFDKYRPEIVYHAAAHKHVPLMEDSPCESIKNNAIGTYKTAYAALMYGCSKFVLISTDKAVNPTNIMGASKRLCEMVIQSFDRMVKQGTPQKIPALFVHEDDDDIYSHSFTPAVSEFKTEFVAVRFGNVLGSNGSVIPLFKKQIESGGPVTVTHPDIIRYFMTIPEAVSLVLQAGVYANGGEIFVLDMGSPVKIDTLAKNLIRLMGYRPNIDIMIEYTGLRPGEKLYEEKLMAEEGLKKTENELIHIGSPIPFDTEKFFVQLEELMYSAYNNDENIVNIVEDIVITYHPAGKNGSEQKGDVYEKLLFGNIHENLSLETTGPIGVKY